MADKDKPKDDVDGEKVDDQAMADEWAAAMEQQSEAEGEGSVEDEWAAAMAEAEKADVGKGKSKDGIKNSAELGNIQAASFESFETSAPPSTGTPDLEVILDIPVTISMEVGSTEIAIRNLLQLNQGSVIELDRLAGEPLNVLVNGTLIAHGEVVMVNEKFGIRLTDVISPSERIKKLK
ncbi:flagellar motor switch protein FliN [Allohahella marinimesophila]|uniref:Flagellar motor switch protein FliN n=1 Tax=Allohahella marinimesophila TaxID=1054972 RepID=A0ABP7PPN2_9GAMM